MNEREIIRRALHMGISTHGEPCSAGETCQAITDFREALAAIERLEAERQPVQTQQMIGKLEHSLNCPERNPMSEEFCTCGLIYRQYLQTEQAMHAAWRKRAEEAEAREAERQSDTARLDWLEIEDMFKPGAKVSVIVRNPLYGCGHTAALLVTNDDPAAVIGALNYLKSRDEVPHPVNSRLPTPDTREASGQEKGSKG